MSAAIAFAEEKREAGSRRRAFPTTCAAREAANASSECGDPPRESATDSRASGGMAASTAAIGGRSP